MVMQGYFQVQCTLIILCALMWCELCTKKAARLLELSIHADLCGSEAAQFFWMFTEKRHILSVSNHAIRQIIRPTLYSSHDHPAALSWDWTAG